MKSLLSSFLVLSCSVPHPGQACPRPERPPYAEAVRSVANMVQDPAAQSLAQQHGLQLLNLTWEDTARNQGSSVGPNISDVTIEVADDRGQRSLMPVLRFPNFSDKTADVRLDRFFIRVGNQAPGRQQDVISLETFLKNPSRYLSLPHHGSIRGGSLWAPRDSHALVSAQSTFLPVPKSGKANFYPVIFNYQSSANHPAVLTLLVTRQGTSMTVVDNSRDTVNGGQSWGQRLFFNDGGKRAPLSAERLSDVKDKGVTQNGESADSLGDDSNLLMLVQIPLKINRPRRMAADDAMPAAPSAMALESWGSGAAKSEKRQTQDIEPPPDMEVAVLGHGAAEGAYTELGGLTVERDPNFPVRVTVQFYQATSSGHMGADHYRALAAQIERVYNKGDYVGSLVVGGPSQAMRPTHPTPAPLPPPACRWTEFPGLRERCLKYGPLGESPVAEPVGIR